jgi:Mg-chelatase subunit ChlD
MRSKIFAIALFALTLGAVVYYPALKARTIDPQPVPTAHIVAPQGAPRVDVVFVLDTTGSMGGLIQTAKDKIWSIATTMASARPTPEIRIGLVAYRDRGDQYVTRVVDLSDDLDSVYATLMDFQAGGGGDTPESVNRALHDAVHNISWSQDPQAYQVVFLVGDAPPHMDYADEASYPEIVKAAAARGIVINTIQCGNMPVTAEPWTQIASLGHGKFFQVEQAGPGSTTRACTSAARKKRKPWPARSPPPTSCTKAHRSNRAPAAPPSTCRQAAGPTCWAKTTWSTPSPAEISNLRNWTRRNCLRRSSQWPRRNRSPTLKTSPRNVPS